MEENSNYCKNPAEEIEEAELTIEERLIEIRNKVPISLIPSRKQYMKRAIELAKKSQHDDGGPYVGAVIVKKGKIIAEAYKIREPWRKNVAGRSSLHLCHAEEKAIEIAGKDAEAATLYVTLEPCTQRNTRGRKRASDTPCVDLIAQAGIAKVVIGMLDQANLDIYCKGALKMLELGIKSVVIYNKGLEEELEKLYCLGAKRRESKQKEYLPYKYKSIQDKDESSRLKKITKIEGGEKRESNRLQKIILDGLDEYQDDKKNK